LLNKIFEIFNSNNNSNTFNNTNNTFNNNNNNNSNTFNNSNSNNNTLYNNNNTLNIYKSIKYFEDKAIYKNLKIYFFLEMAILALLYHSDVFQNNDLYCAFKYCLFYLNQNLLIITYFIIDKVENLEKFLKKDENFEAFYKEFNNNNNIKENNKENNKENKYKDIFSRNLMEKKYLKLCLEKLNENKTWLDKHFIFKNLNNNNKHLVNVCKNICDIFIKSNNNILEFVVVYYEIKDILNDIGKIKLEKNLENFNEKVYKKNNKKKIIKKNKKKKIIKKK
jgi:hypothetical protein